jgi:acyl dehydratase
MIGRTIDEVAVGDAAELARTVTAEDIRGFVGATGDENPLHSDAAFAATTRFGRVIAPGILTGAFLSAVIGTRLPGPGAVYLSQSLRFVRPVHLGDRIVARVEVLERLPERNRLRLATVCTNQGGEVVLEGEAWVMPSRVRVEYRAPAPDVVPASPAALDPAGLALQLASLWVGGSLALARQTLALWEPVRPRPAAEADPARP